MPSDQNPVADSVEILDIRNGSYIRSGKSLLDEVVEGLTSKAKTQAVVEEGLPDVYWNKSLPTVILYQDHGIFLFENITRDPKYYVYHEEMAILARYGRSIVDFLSSPLIVGQQQNWMPAQNHEDPCNVNLTLIDLGAGSLKKAECLLQAIERENSRFQESHGFPKITSTYCAVDIQYQQLRDRLQALLQHNPNFLPGHALQPGEHYLGRITVQGVCGSYLDSLSRLRNGDFHSNDLAQGDRRKCLMWLGSSITNMEPSKAVILLRNFATAALQANDTLLVGVDHCRDINKIKSAYSESSEQWKAYVKNGIRNAGVVLGRDAAHLTAGAENWELVTRWDAENGRHMRFVRCPERLAFSTAAGMIEIDQGELVFVAQSYKYSPEDVEGCFSEAGLHVLNKWDEDKGDCSLYLLQRA